MNPAIRAVTLRAIHEGYKVIGIRRGWAGLVEMQRDPSADNSEYFIELTAVIVEQAGRTGGTFLHSSRTRPSNVARNAVPEHLADEYTEDINAKGYHFPRVVEGKEADCIYCRFCDLICPELAIFTTDSSVKVGEADV